jgi:hypothetical protein
MCVIGVGVPGVGVGGGVQTFCIILFLYGASLFGTLISQVLQL